jgi:hypothetical protein
MQLSVGLSITFVLAVAFALQPKRLHPLELAFAAHVSVFLYLIYFLVVSVNRDLFAIAKKPDLWVVYILFRFIISPIIVLNCLSLIHTMRRKTAKLACFLAFAGVLTVCTWTCRAAGILTYKEWHPAIIYVSWLSHLCLVALAAFWYRSLLQKEVRVP